jgi:hypothetical protein
MFKDNRLFEEYKDLLGEERVQQIIEEEFGKTNLKEQGGVGGFFDILGKIKALLIGNRGAPAEAERSTAVFATYANFKGWDEAKASAVQNSPQFLKNPEKSIKAMENELEKNGIDIPEEEEEKLDVTPVSADPHWPWRSCGPGGSAARKGGRKTTSGHGCAYERENWTPSRDSPGPTQTKYRAGARTVRGDAMV